VASDDGVHTTTRGLRGQQWNYSFASLKPVANASSTSDGGVGKNRGGLWQRHRQSVDKFKTFGLTALSAKCVKAPLIANVMLAWNANR